LDFRSAGSSSERLHPVQFALTTRWLEIASALDYLALLGIWLAFLIAVSFAVRHRFGFLELACILFVAFASYSGSRTSGPTLTPSAERSRRF